MLSSFQEKQIMVIYLNKIIKHLVTQVTRSCEPTTERLIIRRFLSITIVWQRQIPRVHQEGHPQVYTNKEQLVPREPPIRNLKPANVSTFQIICIKYFKYWDETSLTLEGNNCEELGSRPVMITPTRWFWNGWPHIRPHPGLTNLEPCVKKLWPTCADRATIPDLSYKTSLLQGPRRSSIHSVAYRYNQMQHRQNVEVSGQIPYVVELLKKIEWDAHNNSGSSFINIKSLSILKSLFKVYLCFLCVSGLRRNQYGDIIEE